jgi:hypothetical protein
MSADLALDWRWIGAGLIHDPGRHQRCPFRHHSVAFLCPAERNFGIPLNAVH